MPDRIITETVIYYGGLALIHGTALSLLTWLLSAITLRRSRPALQAALWAVVLIKFLLPPVLPGEIAMSGWVAQAVTSATAAEPPGHESLPALLTPKDRDEAIEHPASRSTLSIFASLSLAAYLLAVILLGGRTLRAILRTRVRVRALPQADRGTIDEVLALAASVGLKRPPDVKTTDEGMTPYVFGFPRAVLVLPERLMPTLTEAERRALILHELAHVRRKDQLIRWLQTIVGALFFFFPPVRWVCRRIDHFSEMACDSWAITISGVEPYAYAGALVSVVRASSRASQSHAGLPLVRGTRLLEDRLRAVLRDDKKQSPGLSASAKALLVGWSLFALAGGSVAESRGEGDYRAQTPASEAQEVSSPATADEKYKSTITMPGEVSARRAKRARAARKEAGRAERRQPAGADPPPIKDGALTPYEEGFLLGKRYSEERAKWPPVNAAEGAARERRARPLDAQSRREIELRMQRLIGQPPRQ